MASVKIASKRCIDCQREIKIENKEIIDGYFLVYKRGDKTFDVFKCKECYNKSKALKNFQQCEVYSRIVGYLRPVQQWNEGKQEEYKNRGNYKLS